MSWPAITVFSSNVIASGGDAWQTMWRFNDKEQSLRSSIETETLGSYIASEFLGVSSPQLVNVSVWPWMWFHLLVGQPLSYNLIWILTFVLSGWGMYCLIRVLTLQGSDNNSIVAHAPAFIAGLLYMFLPFHIAHAGGHFGAMQTQWLPLIFAVAVLVTQKPTVLRFAGLMLLVVVQGWTEHHYLLWLAIVTAIAVIWWRKALLSVWSQMTARTRALFAALLIATAALLVATYLPTARLSVQSDSFINLGREQLIRFSGDFFAYVTPAQFHPIWGDFFHTLFSKSFTGNVSESTLYLGIVPLLLILFFHHSIPKEQKKFWITLGVVFFFITLGPRLHVFGNVTAIPLPYELFDELPGLSSVRAVTRAAVIVNIAVAVLFAWVLKNQLHRKGSAIVLSIIILLEFLFYPVVTQSTQMSAVYDEISAIDGRAIIEIPAATNYTAASKALYAQHIHGKEVLGSIALERAQSQEMFELPKSVPAVRQLLYLRTTDIRERRRDFFEQSLIETLPDALHFLDVGAIVIHKDSLSVLQLSSLDSFIKESLGIEARHIDDVVMYTVPDRSQSQSADGVFLMRDSAWQGVRFDEEKNTTFAEVASESTITVVNTRDEITSVILRFSTTAQSKGRGRVIYDDAILAKISPNIGNYGLTLRLEPGEHTVQFIPESNEKIIIQNPTLEVLDSSL